MLAWLFRQEKPLFAVARLDHIEPENVVRTWVHTHAALGELAKGGKAGLRPADAQRVSLPRLIGTRDGRSRLPRPEASRARRCWRQSAMREPGEIVRNGREKTLARSQEKHLRLGRALQRWRSDRGERCWQVTRRLSPANSRLRGAVPGHNAHHVARLLQAHEILQCRGP